MDVGGDLGTFLGADAHQSFLGEVLCHAYEIGAGQQRDTGEHGDGGGQRGAELGRRATHHEEGGEAETDQRDARESARQVQHPAAAADLHPARPSRVVGLPPHQDGTRADQQGRPDVTVRLAAHVDVADEDHGADEECDQGEDLALVGLAESAPAVGGGLEEGPLHPGRPAGPSDTADPERHDDPEHGVEQGAQAVREEQSEEDEPDPDDGQSQMSGEPARDAAEHPPVGAAVQLARRLLLRVRGVGARGSGRGCWHAPIVTRSGEPWHQGLPGLDPEGPAAVRTGPQGPPEAISGIGQGRRGPHEGVRAVTMDP